MSKSNLNVDYGYYNVVMNNTTNDIITATFDETRTTPILTRMEDFQLSLIRFKIPSVSIPLMVFEEDSSGVSPYYVAFSEGDNYDNIQIENVVYDPNMGNTVRLDNPYSRFIYYYSSFINMVNKAIQNLWDSQGYQTEECPYFTLDENTNKFVFVLPFNEDAPTGTYASPFIKQPNVALSQLNFHMSSKLFYFFAGFNAKKIIPPQPNVDYVFNFDYKTAIEQIATLQKYGDDFPTRKVINWFQDYSSVYLFNTLSRILITTTMPIESEFIAVKGANGQNFNQALLTDFEIVANKDGSLRDYIYYFSDNNRFINFTANGDLINVNIRIYYQDKFLNTYLVEIPQGFEASLKILFKRRKAIQLLQYSDFNKNMIMNGNIRDMGIYT